MKKTSLFLLIIFLSTACSDNMKSNKKTLELNYLSDVNSLDPRFGYEIPANHTVKMLFEGLMRVSPKGELIAAAAQSYAVSEDKKTYLFYIRPAKWSNGQPVRAYDFEYAWKSVIDPSIPTQGAADFYPIKNVEKIVKGELTLDAAGVKAIDDTTLLVELEYPSPYFLELTASSAYSPVHAKTSQIDPTIEMYAISNGPFVLKQWHPHDCICLEKNPTYWNAEAVNFENIHISIVEDVSTQLALFEKGKSDWFGKPFAKLPLDAVPTLEKNRQLTYIPERAVYWYFLNTQKFPFNHPKIRKAFGLAMSRQQIVDHVLKEGEQVAMSVNRACSYFQDADTEQALVLFEEALAELDLTRESFPTIPLSYCGIEANHRIACVAQRQWEDIFAIKVKLDPQEWTLYYDNLSTGNFLIGGMSWHSRIRDPIYNLQLFKYANDRLNMSFWENTQYQVLLDQAQQELDEAKRADLLAQSEALLMDEMPVIPIYFLTISYAKNKALESVYISDLNEIDFAWATK